MLPPFLLFLGFVLRSISLFVEQPVKRVPIPSPTSPLTSIEVRTFVDSFPVWVVTVEWVGFALCVAALLTLVFIWQLERKNREEVRAAQARS